MNSSTLNHGKPIGAPGCCFSTLTQTPCICYSDSRLFSQARRRKDSPLISAGGRLNSENSPVPLKYATLLGQINVRCRESTEGLISQSALLLSSRARPSRAYTQTFPSNNCETANWSGGRLSTGTVTVDWFPRIPRFRRGLQKQPTGRMMMLVPCVVYCN